VGFSVKILFTTRKMPKGNAGATLLTSRCGRLVHFYKHYGGDARNALNLNIFALPETAPSKQGEISDRVNMFYLRGDRPGWSKSAGMCGELPI